MTAAPDLEAQIQTLRDGGDLRSAATCAIEGYGPEVLGFLVSFLRSDTDASDAFGQACEDLWTGIPGFEGRSTMRAWFYTLARHAAARLRRSPHRRPGRHVPVSDVGEVAELVRSRTLEYLRTTAKDKLAVIRDTLDPDDRALLVLRVDRGLSWREIARVLLSEEDAADEARATARLRKRFQLVKDEIRARALEAGLLEGD
jgi:RNA polymerase sigma-70 factor (ECF subfamily)